jgi:hypothetical protein
VEAEEMKMLKTTMKIAKTADVQGGAEATIPTRMR